MIIKVVLVAIVALTVVFLLYTFFPVVRVEGDSMHPTLAPGKYVIGRRLLFKKNCKLNKIYIIHLKDVDGKPYYVIKRLCRITQKGYWFLGDNSKVSHDSRHYGYVNPKKVIAVVMTRK